MIDLAASGDAARALASDWAFMVNRDTAAGHARDRAGAHSAVHELADLLDAAEPAGAAALAERLPRVDRPFGHLDALVF